MGIFKQLENNKGTVSSALGKQLAAEVLAGDLKILFEAIDLCSFDLEEKKSKNIRAGAAKIVEIVAEKKPALVAPYLNKLMASLTADEAQPKWMTFRTMGFCAKQNPTVSEKAIPYAISCLENPQGLCLSSSAVLYLGDLGATSKDYAKTAFPIIEKASKAASINEVDWILESYMKLCPNLDEQKDAIKKYALSHQDAKKKSTQKRVSKLLKIIDNK
jgi:hypothetical protein